MIDIRLLDEENMLKGIKNKETRQAIRYILEQQNILEHNSVFDKDAQKVLNQMKIINRNIGSMKELNEIDSEFEHAIKDTWRRAEEVWGMSYTEASGGYYPSGNQIGRRDFIPQDFGLDTWMFGITSGQEKVTPIHFYTSDETFLVFKGVAYKSVHGDIPEGIKMTLTGVELPLVPIGRHYYKNQDYLVHYYGKPVVLSPKSEMMLDIFSGKTEGYAIEMVLLGQVVAKRQYLLKSPSDVLRVCQCEGRDMRNRL